MSKIQTLVSLVYLLKSRSGTILVFLLIGMPFLHKFQTFQLQTEKKIHPNHKAVTQEKKEKREIRDKNQC